MFFVVAVADGLSVRDVEGAIAAGPPHVAAGHGYRALLEEAGFAGPEMIDVTDEYSAALSSSIRARDAEKPRLARLIGPDQFAEGQSNRRRELAAVEGGLLVRRLVTTVRP